jgi:hypothetical protein
MEPRDSVLECGGRGARRKPALATPLSSSPTANENKETPESGVKAAALQDAPRLLRSVELRDSVLECGGRGARRKPAPATPLSSSPTANENEETPESGVKAAALQDAPRLLRGMEPRGSVLECGGRGARRKPAPATPLSTAPTANENEETPESGVKAAALQDAPRLLRGMEPRDSVLECGGRMARRKPAPATPLSESQTP